MKSKIILTAGIFLFVVSAQAQTNFADYKQLPVYFHDRGKGMWTSLFGTYIQKHELLIYPFFEYSYQHDFEYPSSDPGFNGDQTYRSKYKQGEYLVYLGYAINNWMGVEFESGVYTSIKKASADTSKVPTTYKETGFGDTQIEFNFRLLTETSNRPDVFAYQEFDLPFQKNKHITGKQELQSKSGVGLSKGFSFGTLTSRFAIIWAPQAGTVKIGEYSLEYLKRISPVVRIYSGFEGTNLGELEYFAEVQPHFGKRKDSFIRLNDGIGLTNQTLDHLPEIGVLISLFPKGK